MAKLNFSKKVPNGYTYPLTYKEIKSFAASHKKISAITNGGISPHDQIKKSKQIWLGELVATKEEDAWEYFLKFYASRSSLFGKNLTKIKQLVIKEIEKWIEWNSIKLASPITFNRLYLSVIEEKGKIISTTQEHTTTGFIK